MFRTGLPLLFSILLAGAEGDVSGSLAALVSSLTLKADSELTVISDFPRAAAQTDLVAYLAAAGVPSTVHEAKALDRLQEEDFSHEPCPIVGQTNNTSAEHWYRLPDDQIVIRRQLLPAHNRHRSILVWVESSEALKTAIEIFDKTVLWCSQYKDPGIYHRSTKFFFFAAWLNRNEALNIIFDSDNMRRHPTVALIQQLQEDKFGFYSYDFFHESAGSPRFSLNAVLAPDTDDDLVLEDAFASLENFHGHTIRIALCPYAPLALGTWLEEGEEDGVAYHRYTDLWGYDFEMLWIMQARLNFTYTTFSDPDFDWGKISKDHGNWTGLTGYAESGFTDMIFGGYVFSDLASMVMQPKFFLEKDFLAFVSPPPRPKNNLYTLVTLFDAYSWIAIFCATTIAGIAISATIKMESFTTGGVTKESAIAQSFIGQGGGTGLMRSMWVCSAILIQESLPRRMLLEKKNAMRILMGSWLLYSLIISNGFSGALKAVLTRPDFTKSAETIEDFVYGDYIWQMDDFESADADSLAASTDPAMIKLREGAIHIDYQVVPELKDVYGGNTVLLEWYSSIETAIHLKYTTAEGKPMVHLDPDPIWYANWNSWAFNKMVPWVGKFDDPLTRIIESGLIRHWKERTWARMKAEEGSGRVEVPEQSVAMKLEHFYGSMVFCGALLAVAAVLLVAELLYSKNTGGGGLAEN